MSLKDEMLPPVPPEMQAEFDEWEKASEEDIAAFAIIHFLSNGEGGRSLPVLPGQTVNAHIKFRRPEAQRGRLHVGMVFKFREGNRTVGEGTLTWVSASFEE